MKLNTDYWPPSGLLQQVVKVFWSSAAVLLLCLQTNNATYNLSRLNISRMDLLAVNVSMNSSCRDIIIVPSSLGKIQNTGHEKNFILLIQQTV